MIGFLHTGIISTFDVTWNHRQSFPIPKISFAFISLVVFFLYFYSPCPPLSLTFLLLFLTDQSSKNQSIQVCIQRLVNDFPGHPLVLLCRAASSRSAALVLTPSWPPHILIWGAAWLSFLLLLQNPFPAGIWDVTELWLTHGDLARSAHVVTVQHSQPGAMFCAERCGATWPHEGGSEQQGRTKGRSRQGNSRSMQFGISPQEEMKERFLTRLEEQSIEQWLTQAALDGTNVPWGVFRPDRKKVKAFCIWQRSGKYYNIFCWEKKECILQSRKI